MNMWISNLNFYDVLGIFCNPGSDEQKFLEASMAYVAGKPIMNDEEYDKLKLRLKVCEVFFFFFFLNIYFVMSIGYKNYLYIPY